MTLQVILRIVPTILIFSLNIWIYLRLKAISKRRKKARGKRNQDNWRTKIKRYRSRSSRASSAHSVDVSVISSSVLSTAPPPSIVVEPPSEDEEEEDPDHLSVIEEEEQEEEVCRLPVPDLIMDVNRARQAPPKQQQQQQQQQQQPPSSKKAASEDALRSALRLSLLSSVAATAVSFSDTVDVISLAPTVCSSALSLNNVEEEEKEQKKRGSWRPRKIVNTFAR